MQTPPQWYGPPPVYRGPTTKNVVLIVIAVLGGVFLLCCLGGGLFFWRSGLSDAYSCSNLTSEGEYKKAIPYCRALVEKIPNDASSHNNLGWCLVLDGQLQEGVAECRKAIELDPARNSYDSLAMGLALSGHGQEALQTETQHVMVNGDVADDSERVTLGMVYYSVGRKQEALKEWEIARKGFDPGARKLAIEFEAKHPV